MITEIISKIKILQSQNERIGKKGERSQEESLGLTDCNCMDWLHFISERRIQKICKSL